MSDPNQQPGDFGPVASAAFAAIAKDAGFDPKGWTGPKIVADGGTYKLDWYAPEPDETYLTLYDDGIWQLYDATGRDKEGKVPPCHSKVWKNRLIKAGVVPVVAVFSVYFFDQLRRK